MFFWRPYVEVRFRKRLSHKIILAVVGIVCLLMSIFAWGLIEERSVALERMAFDRARTHALVGARAVQAVLEELQRNGTLTTEQLFDTAYRPIQKGLLAGSRIPKYATAYDKILDLRIREFEDSFLRDPSVAYAVLVDRNGYLPTHNSIYSRPLTGNPDLDVGGNRTKRIFNDPVGLNAARYTGNDGHDVLRQVYHRDTGVTMWDVTAPVYVNGEHWGGFRIGLSMRQIEAQVANLRNTVLLSALALMFFAALTIAWVVKGNTRRLANLSERLGEFADSGHLQPLPVKAPDEIGQVAKAFNHLHETLDQVTVSRDYLDRILDSMNDSLMVVSPGGRILKANAASSRLLGYSRVELTGMEIEKIINDTAEDGVSWFDHFIVSRDGEQVELEYCTVDGAAVPVLFSGALLGGEGEETDALICLAQNITDRKVAEEKIRSAKRFLETVLDSLKEEMTILNAHDLTILKANRAFAESYGASPEELVGRTCHEVTHGLDHPCGSLDHTCPVLEVMEFGRVETCEHLHTTPDGRKKYVEIQLTPIFNDAEEPRYLIHMARDITSRKESELELQRFAEELEQNNRALAEKTAELEAAHAELKASQSRILQQEKMASIGQLSAGVAHEINNPIGFINSNLTTLGKYASRLIVYLGEQERLFREHGMTEIGEELARQRRKLKIDYIVEDLQELISESLEGTDRVKKIVLDLKGFSRVDDAECKEVDLHECLESTINIAWNEIKYKATLRREYGDIPRVHCFPQQLNQVFMNLLVNAAHAIEEQGEITVSTGMVDDMVNVSIADTGCGIREEVRKRIFEPFFTTKEVGKGTGLGLSISYDIVKKHHGEIVVESEPGRGTTFHVRLPLKVEEAMAC